MRQKVMLIAAVSLLAIAADVMGAKDLYDSYFYELMIGQKWQFEVTDLETNEVSIANVVLEGDSINQIYDDLYAGNVVRVIYDNAPEERYYLYNFINDNKTGFDIHSDKLKSGLAILAWDCYEGALCYSDWSNRSNMVTCADYIYVADRARKRMTLQDAESGSETRYVTGVGLDYFETSTEDWTHRRSYRLIKTEYPDGTEFWAKDFDSPRIVPDNKYYEDGMTIIYDGRQCGSKENTFVAEYRVVGDTVAFHVPSKKIELWISGEKESEFAVFDIDGQVYRTGFSNLKSFKPYVIYNLEVGDRVMKDDDSSEVTDIFEREIDGVVRRVFRFSGIEYYGADAFYGYWIEGVGPNWGDGFDAMMFRFLYLNGLYRDGECLFSYSSLFNDVGLESLPEEEDKELYNEEEGEEALIYNLRGVRIERPLSGQPYIRNGRITIDR